LERVLGGVYYEVSTPLPFQLAGCTVHVHRTPRFFPGVPELYVFFIVNDTDHVITVVDMCVCQDALHS
jgi:hypothetical protein